MRRDFWRNMKILLARLGRLDIDEELQKENGPFDDL